MARSSSSGQHGAREAERRERREAKAQKRAARRAGKEAEGQGSGKDLPEAFTVCSEGDDT